MGGEIVLKPKDLKIVWGHDRRYWRNPGQDQQDKPARLLQVCWLEVTGEVKVDPDPDKKYQIYFEISLTPDAFGWSNAPIYIMAKRGKRGRYFFRKINLGEFECNERKTIPYDLILKKPPSPPDDGTIYFGLYEVWSGLWKGGLKIYQAVVKEYEEQPST